MSLMEWREADEREWMDKATWERGEVPHLLLHTLCHPSHPPGCCMPLPVCLPLALHSSSPLFFFFTLHLQPCTLPILLHHSHHSPSFLSFALLRLLSLSLKRIHYFQAPAVWSGQREQNNDCLWASRPSVAGHFFFFLFFYPVNSKRQMQLAYYWHITATTQVQAKWKRLCLIACLFMFMSMENCHGAEGTFQRGAHIKRPGERLKVGFNFPQLRQHKQRKLQTKSMRTPACHPQDSNQRQVMFNWKQHYVTSKISIWWLKSLDGDQEDCPDPEGKAEHAIAQSVCVFLGLSARNYLTSHLQLATSRQLGLYSQGRDVFSTGIYSPHRCPARKTPSHSYAAHPELNKENVSVRSEVSLPWKELSVENVSGKIWAVSIALVTFSTWILGGRKRLFFCIFQTVSCFDLYILV